MLLKLCMVVAIAIAVMNHCVALLQLPGYAFRQSLGGPASASAGSYGPGQGQMIPYDDGPEELEEEESDSSSPDVTFVCHYWCKLTEYMVSFPIAMNKSKEEKEEGEGQKEG